LSQKISALLIITLLLVGTLSVSSNFALADDKDKDKKPKTLQDYCKTLDDKNGFPALVCTAISGITNSIQNLQDQINHIQLVQFPQRCPTGQEMVGIDIQGKIICEISTAQSQTSVIVTLSKTSIQVDPHVGAPDVLLTGAAIGLSPNTAVTIGDGLGNVFLTGTSDSKGIFSWPISIPAGSPTGTFFIHVTDANGRTGSASLTITLPPPPPPSASVQLLPPSGPAGTSLTITASGLTPNSGVTITVVPPSIILNSGTTDSTGHYSVTIPVTSGGPTNFNYQIVVTDSHGITGSAGFLLTP
jgi:hypothetical protein